MRPLSILALFFAVLTWATGTSGQTLVGGAITSNQTWTTANSPYEVTSEIVVYNLARLTIEPGVTVRFRPNTGLVVGYYNYDYTAINNAERGALTVNGTAEAPVLFTATSRAPGGWRGLAFGAATDFGGLNSTLHHLTIADAGQAQTLNGTVGATSAGLMLFSTGNGFTFDHVTLETSSGHGASAFGSVMTATSLVALNNGLDGLRATSSTVSLTGGRLSRNGARGATSVSTNASLTGVELDANAGKGFAEDSGTATLTGCTLSNNGGYAVSYPVGHGMNLNGNTFTGNANPGVEVQGGALTSNRSWTGQAGEPFYTITTSEVVVYNLATLTVAAGTTVRFAPGTGLIVGYYNYDYTTINNAERGALNVQGTAGAPVLFTSTSGVPGGWRGVAFGAASDYGALFSTLSHLTIEDAGQAQTLGGTVGATSAGLMLFATGDAFQMSFVTVRDSSGYGVYADSSVLPAAALGAEHNALDGIRAVASSVSLTGGLSNQNGGTGVTLTNTSGAIGGLEVDGNGAAGIALTGSGSPTIVGCVVTNNTGHAITFPLSTSQPSITGNAFAGNTLPGIGVVGGPLTSNLTLTGQGGEPTFTVTGAEILVYNLARLTISAGTTMRFAPGTGLIIGYYNYDYTTINNVERGALTVEGTQLDPVTFTSTVGGPGSWKGLAFGAATDYGALTSSLWYLTISNAGQAQTLGGTVGATSAGLMLFSTGNGFTLDHVTVETSSGVGAYALASTLSATSLAATANADVGVRAQSGTLALVGGSASQNGGSGVFAQSTNGSLSGVAVSGNGATGLVLATGGALTIAGCLIDDNQGYALSYPIGMAPSLTGNTLAGNVNPGIEVVGGGLTSNHTWAFQSGEPVFTVTGGEIVVYNSARLTVEPGVTARFASGTGLTIGYYAFGLCTINCVEGGALTATGGLDTPVIFTSVSGLPGGWRGLVFGTAANASGISRLVVANAGQSTNVGGTVGAYQANIGLHGVSPTLDHVTVVRSAGHGLAAFGASPLLRNAIVAFNGASGLFATPGGTPDVQYIDTFGNGAANSAFSGGPDLQADPRFVAAAAGDFRLGDTSPCLGAGKAIGLPFQGAAPDLGAYEGFESDQDADGVGDGADNCPAAANPDQLDSDADAEGDACDLDDDNDGYSDADELAAGSNPLDATSNPEICDGVDNDGDGQIDEGAPDTDGDTLPDCRDNCPSENNVDQANADGDPFGDACDNCPLVASRGQSDADADGYGDVCDINTTCGNGLLDTTLEAHRACPSPVVTTTVTTPAQLQVWLAGPRTTALRITRAIAWDGDLSIVTPCNVTTTSTAPLTANNLLIAGAAVSVGAPVTVAGTVDLRGSVSAKATATATFHGVQELDFESPVVDDRSAASFTRRYCAEGGTYYLGDAAHAGLDARAVAEVTGSNLRLGTFSDLQSLSVIALDDLPRAQTGRIAHRSTSVLRHITRLELVSENTTTLSGTLTDLGEVSFAGLTPAAKFTGGVTARVESVAGSVRLETPGGVALDGVWQDLGPVTVVAGGLLASATALVALDGTIDPGLQLGPAGDVTLRAGTMSLAGDWQALGNLTAGSTGNLVLVGRTTLADGRVKPGFALDGARAVSLSSGATLQANGAIDRAVSVTADSVLVSSTRTARIETSGDVTLTTTGAGTSSLYGTIAHDGEIRLQLAGDLRLYGAITDNGRVAISTGRYRLFAGYSLGANAACVLTGTVLAGSVPLVGCSGPLVEN